MQRRRSSNNTLVAGIAACCMAPCVGADEGVWALCPDASTAPAPVSPAGPPLEGGHTRFLADFAEIANQNLFTLRGNVEMDRDRERLLADLMSYDRSTGKVRAKGDIHYYENGLVVNGASGYFDLLTKRGELEDITFRYEPRHGRGAATRGQLEEPKRIHLNDVSFTTCSPGNHDWYLRAKDLWLDRNTATGTAKHAFLEFKGVPVLYTPYLSFPLNDERRSGFLTPRFGTSQETGVDVRIPYYWNIAPNRDATFAPRFLSRRGPLLGGEFRYLNPANHGQVYAEYMPHDKVYDGARGLLSTQHQGSIAPRWFTDIDAAYVSDDNYLEELGSSLASSSISFLEQRGDLLYVAPAWSLLARVQGFQTLQQNVAPEDRPYERLPQLLLQANLPKRPLGMEYGLRGEVVHFRRNETVTGDRVDLQPTVQWPFIGRAGYVTPSFKLWQTNYRLDNAGPGISDSQSRTLPLMSVDAGAYFERSLAWGSGSYLQTLEPRLYYLYVPGRNQDDLPVFDSAQRDLSFGLLYQDNRFSGADRVGDANQVTLGLVSRLLDRETGRERLRAGIGQIRYFENLNVTLPGEAVYTRSASNILGELAVRLTQRWSGYFTVEWDQYDNSATRSGLQLHYEPERGRMLNLAYRRVDPDVKQTDISLLWPITPNWSVVGRWNYSLEDSRTLETVFGLGYDTCCWSLRVAGRRYISEKDNNLSNNSAVFVEAELKGLTRVGRRIEELLERGIFGDEF